MDTNTLKRSLMKTKALLEKNASRVQVIEEAITHFDRLEKLVVDPSDEDLKEIIRMGRKLKENINQFGDQASSVEFFLEHLSGWVEERFMKRTHVVAGQIEMQPIQTDGFILDIGGGGEGIIGKLNGRNVVAIDLSPPELEETENEALKIIMDATDMKFVSSSFDVVTSFFTLLYVDRNKQEKVFEEVHRVLKEGGRFLIWDVGIPDRVEGKSFFLMRLEIDLPDEKVSTGYGVPLFHQDIESFKDLAANTGLKVVNEWIMDEIFHLELVKQ